MTELETILGNQVMRQGLELKVLRALVITGQDITAPIWIDASECLHIFIQGINSLELIVDCIVTALNDRGRDVNNTNIIDACYWFSGGECDDECHLALYLDQPVSIAA